MDEPKPSICLPKEKFSENVVRKALYWFSQYCLWQLKERDTEWLIYIENEMVDSKFHFDRLLNDQLLREKIDIQTADLRRSIVRKVLSGIENTL